MDDKYLKLAEELDLINDNKCCSFSDEPDDETLIRMSLENEIHEKNEDIMFLVREFRLRHYEYKDTDERRIRARKNLREAYGDKELLEKIIDELLARQTNKKEDIEQ